MYKIVEKSDLVADRLSPCCNHLICKGKCCECGDDVEASDKYASVMHDDPNYYHHE